MTVTMAICTGSVQAVSETLVCYGVALQVNNMQTRNFSDKA